ncbi:polyketide synthase [Marinitenerispora sediminis]|uniref:Polyketide synthase n=3 Tax=Marinitenerispora sediminis TaxID=1931232 RepID=A0A368SY85_9ACTN|nr:polyketide synthase [Marinitenerispora sediminis]
MPTASGDTGADRCRAAPTGPAPARPRPVALLLPGQGAQHVRMAAGLYPHEPVFSAAMDEVFTAMGEDGTRLRADWVAERPTVPIDHVTRSQPLLFAVDYALGRLVASWGIRPAALLGHSIGEMAAAALAGVFDLSDAAGIVLDRVRRLLQAPPGGMLAVAAAPGELGPHLHGDVVVGAVNAPRQTVLAGPREPLAAVAAALAERGFTCRPVPSLVAFHSPAVAAATAGAEQLLASVRVRPPDIPVYSGYTAAPLRAAQIADPGFWARQPVAPVLFWPALDALLGDGAFLLVEAGPGQGLTQVARRHPAVRAGRSAVLPLLPARLGPPRADRQAVAAARAALLAEARLPERR